MASKETTSGLGARLFFNAACCQGLKLDEIEKETGIILKRLEKPTVRFQIAQLEKLAAIAYQVTGDPALALHLFPKYCYRYETLLIHLLLNCSSLKEMFQCWSLYAGLESGNTRIKVFDDKENVVVCFDYDFSEQHIWIPEYHLAGCIVNSRMFLGQTFTPVEVRFQHPAPEYISAYRKLFKCPVICNAGENALVINKDDMVKPIASANSFLKQILKNQADEVLQRFIIQESYKEKVQNLIENRLSEGAVDIEKISCILNMDRTTLHRKLKKEGTSFTDVLADTRQKLANKYLRRGYKVSEIAYQLGFSDSSAFQCAFKRWYGQSPGQYRNHLIAD
ncbi:AraC family transcriptional regulator [bacterium]|nr:AraC family transcriptional regulator [bacterium]